MYKQKRRVQEALRLIAGELWWRSDRPQSHFTSQTAYEEYMRERAGTKAKLHKNSTHIVLFGSGVAVAYCVKCLLENPRVILKEPLNFNKVARLMYGALSYGHVTT